MDFKLGEFVRFVDEKREGYITKIFDESMVGVTGDDDFEIPTTVKNLTRVHGHSNYKENTITEATPQILETFKGTGIYLAVAPDLNKGSVVHFHLVNDTSYQLFVTLNSEKSGKFKGEFADKISPLATQKIYVASLPELENWPQFVIRILPYTTADKTIAKPIYNIQNFRAKDFSGAQKKAPLLNQPAWVIQLDEEELKIDVQKLKESFFKAKEETTVIEKPSKEVDLHIEKLRPDFVSLSSVEMIEYQLNYFNRILDAAIFHKYISIIFIHGVGNGTLKTLLHKQLGKHPQVKTFMDAHKEKFGYGATQVFFK
jgi:hypothetical protein